MRTLLVWAALGATTLVAACSAPGVDVIGTAEQALTTPFANDKAAYDYFAGKGLTSFQAAAIVGNLDQESGVNPTISQSGGGVGRGIAQWSKGGRWDTSKDDNVIAYAQAHGQSESSLALQLDFMWYELTTFSDYGLDKLKATTNVTDATQVFEDNYEGCVYAQYPECALPQRVTYAKDVLAAYGSDPVQGSGGGASASAGTGGTSAAGSSASSGGAGGSGLASAGAPSSAGSTSSAGAPSSSGGSSAGGSPGSAGGGSSAGAANVAGSSAAVSDTSADSSGCSVSSPAAGTRRGASLAFGGLLCALALGLRVTRRRGAVRR